MNNKTSKRIINAISAFGMLTAVLNFLIAMVIIFQITPLNLISGIWLVNKEVGIISAFFCIGLFMVYLNLFYLKNWARKTAIIFSIIVIAFVLLSMGETPILEIIEIILNLLILYFLGFNNQIKSLFSHAMKDKKRTRKLKK